MKILHLTLKKRWFDMVDSLEKKEEYRDDIAFIRSRLMWANGDRKEYNAICFINGYRPDSRRVTLKYLGFEFREGKPEWGAVPGVKYFVIKLGEKL
jgi:hypothetical protein